MIVSPDVLRRDVVRLLTSINIQIDEIEKTAEKLGVPPQHLRDAHGSWVMVPLLLAKTQAYSTLVQLNDQGTKR